MVLPSPSPTDLPRRPFRPHHLPFWKSDVADVRTADHLVALSRIPPYSSPRRYVDFRYLLYCIDDGSASTKIHIIEQRDAWQEQRLWNFKQERVGPWSAEEVESWRAWLQNRKHVEVRYTWEGSGGWGRWEFLTSPP